MRWLAGFVVRFPWLVLALVGVGVVAGLVGGILGLILAFATRHLDALPSGLITVTPSGEFEPAPTVSCNSASLTSPVSLGEFAALGLGTSELTCSATGENQVTGSDQFSVDIVDQDLGTGGVDPNLEQGDPRLELGEVLLDALASLGAQSVAALLEILREHRERLGVVLEHVVDLTDVVEDAVVGCEIVGSFELDERCAVVPLLEQLGVFEARVGAGQLEVLVHDCSYRLRPGPAGQGKGSIDQEPRRW
mgnify:CR=1 FL=1